MTRKLQRIARKALKLMLIELLVPGGTLVVLALLLLGSSTPTVPDKVVPLFIFLKALRRPRGHWGKEEGADPASWRLEPR
jgi:hypothetical protein